MPCNAKQMQQKIRWKHGTCNQITLWCFWVPPIPFVLWQSIGPFATPMPPKTSAQVAERMLLGTYPRVNDWNTDSICMYTYTYTFTYTHIYVCVCEYVCLCECIRGGVPKIARPRHAALPAYLPPRRPHRLRSCPLFRVRAIWGGQRVSMKTVWGYIQRCEEAL